MDPFDRGPTHGASIFHVLSKVSCFCSPKTQESDKCYPKWNANCRFIRKADSGAFHLSFFALSVFLTENGFVSHYTTRYHHWRLHPWLDRAYHARKLARRLTYDFFGGIATWLLLQNQKSMCAYNTFTPLPSPFISYIFTLN